MGDLICVQVYVWEISFVCRCRLVYVRKISFVYRFKCGRFPVCASVHVGDPFCAGVRLGDILFGAGVHVGDLLSGQV